MGRRPGEKQNPQSLFQGVLETNTSRTPVKEKQKPSSKLLGFCLLFRRATLDASGVRDVVALMGTPGLKGLVGN